MELARPVNGTIAGAAVVVGAFVSRSPTHWGAALLGAGSAFAAAAGANALNDALDRDIDAVNRPDRPIPSGRVEVPAAVRLAVAAYGLSLILAALVGPGALALAGSWVILTGLYSRSLKGLPIAGNVAVALVASTPFLMGGLTQGRYLLALIPSALAFLLHLARELVKDVEDMKGDAAAGVNTFAVRRGARATFALVRAVLVVLIAAAAVPFAFRIYGWGYAAVVIVIDAALVWLMASMNANADSGGLRRPSVALKGVMALGLVAFVLGVL